MTLSSLMLCHASDMWHWPSNLTFLCLHFPHAKCVTATPQRISVKIEQVGDAYKRFKSYICEVEWALSLFSGQKPELAILGSLTTKDVCKSIKQADWLNLIFYFLSTVCNIINFRKTCSLLSDPTATSMSQNYWMHQNNVWWQGWFDMRSKQIT